MRNSTVAALAVMLAGLTALPAWAGVIVTQETTHEGGMHSGAQATTIMVEGGKQKRVTSSHTIVIDLDKGLMRILDPTSKTYVESDFPPRGIMASMAQRAAASLNYRKTGKHRAVAGYPCNEYSASGKLPMMGDFSVVACFSDSAPGAADFTAFDRRLALKMKESAHDAPEPPAGVPLAAETTTKPNVSVAGLKPEQQKMISQMMANRPPVVSKTVVLSIKAAHLGPETFETPPGYAKAAPATPLAHPHGGSATE